MADTLTEKSQGVEVGWEGAIKDAIAMQKYLTAQAQSTSAVVRGAMTFMFWLMLCVAFFYDYTLIASHAVGPANLLFAIYFTLLWPVILLMPRLTAIIIARRTVGQLGLRIFEAQSYYVRHTMPDLDSLVLWSQYARLAYDRGDVYIFMASNRAVRIPLRAFGTKRDAEEAFSKLRGLHQAAKAGLSAQTTDQNVWPPAPRVKIGNLPLVGPEFSAAYSASEVVSPEELRRSKWQQVPRKIAVTSAYVVAFSGAFVLRAYSDFGWTSLIAYAAIVVVVAAMTAYQFHCTLACIKAPRKMVFTTDYKWVRFAEPGAMFAVRVGALYGVSMLGGGLNLRLGPETSVLIPRPLFRSPNDARDVAEKLRAEIRAEKGRPREK